MYASGKEKEPSNYKWSLDFPSYNFFLVISWILGLVREELHSRVLTGVFEALDSITSTGEGKTLAKSRLEKRKRTKLNKQIKPGNWRDS